MEVKNWKTIVSTIILMSYQPVLNSNLETPDRVTLEDDPSLFPGHLEPIGTKQPKTNIEVLQEYPSPKDYFVNFIRPGRPFLVKGGAKYQRAYKFWTDEYMINFKDAEKEFVQVEPNKKEVREAKGFEISFKEFLQRYRKEKIYMVNKVPSFLQKDVMMPPPLRCNNTRDLMLDHVTWMSSGGTKSVLHQDDLDNINCLFRGEKDLLFINPIKYGSKVPIDKPEGGYSSVDVDKVNFTKYPSMREIEYIECHMEEGDCLFIPRGWYHQVNSKSNQDNQNIAVNIWFRHDAQHIPKNCDLPEEKSSIDNFHFSGLDSLIGGEESETENETFQTISLLQWSLGQTKYRRASFKTFTTLLKRVPGFITKEDISHVELDNNFYNVARLIFDAVNVDHNKYIDEKDFTKIYEDDDGILDVESYVSAQLRNLQMIADSLLMNKQQSSSTKETEEKDEL